MIHLITSWLANFAILTLKLLHVLQLCTCMHTACWTKQRPPDTPRSAFAVHHVWSQTLQHTCILSPRIIIIWSVTLSVCISGSRNGNEAYIKICTYVNIMLSACYIVHSMCELKHTYSSLHQVCSLTHTASLQCMQCFHSNSPTSQTA